jgi:FixJ family two-component response regulator
MSGYSDEELVARELLTAHTRFLGKPFTGARLLETVRSVLEYDARTAARAEWVA